MTQPDHHEVQSLKRELIGLFDHIQRIRKEIASIRRPGADDDNDKFIQMSDELDAIVQATEQATDTIMDSVENVEDLVNAALPLIQDQAAKDILAQVPEKTAAIFEACAFQDITGQRITKVVTSLQYVETRVNSLIHMWGSDELTKVEAEDQTETDEYKKYLNGPQLSGHGVSQADVDAMFDSPKPPAPPAKPAATPARQAPAKPAAAQPAPPKPTPPPPPKAAPAPPAPPPPAPPKPASAKAEEDPDAPKLGQDDIDKLFG